MEWMVRRLGLRRRKLQRSKMLTVTTLVNVLLPYRWVMRELPPGRRTKQHHRQSKEKDTAATITTEEKASPVSQNILIGTVGEPAKLVKEHVVCVFLSSPFGGIEEERERIVDHWVPQLRFKCEAKGHSLCVVDFRWGITREQGDSNLTGKLCLEAVDECDVFIGMLGARYGASKLTGHAWIDDNLKLALEKYPWLEEFGDRSPTEWEFRSAFLNENASKSSFFIFRDIAFDEAKLNLIDEEYEALVAHLDKKESKVAETLSSTPNGDLPRQMVEVLKCTAQEMENRSLQPLIAYLDKEIKLTREEIALDKENLKLRSQLSEILESDKIGIPKKVVEILKKFVQDKKGEQQRRWKDSGPRRDDFKVPKDGMTQNKLALAKLKEEVKAKIRSTGVGLLYDGYPQPSKGVDTVMPKVVDYVCDLIRKPSKTSFDAHDAYAQARISCYCEPTGLLDKAIAGVRDGQEENLLVVVVGEPGSGKSSLMAKLAKSETWRAPVFFHFVGCNAQSTRLESMMDRFRMQCNDKLNLEEERVDPGEALDKLFRAIDKKKSSAVFLMDALNQLDDNLYGGCKDGATVHDLEWLPKTVNQNITLVLSSIPGHPVTEELGRRTAKWVRIKPLAADDRETMVKTLLENNKKTGSSDVLKILCESQQCDNPLFLSLCVKELVSFGSFEELEDRARLLARQTDIRSLIVVILQSLEETFTKDLVSMVATMVWASSEGMTADEVTDVVNLRIPESDWYPLMYASHGRLFHVHNDLLNYVHNSVRQAVEERYLLEPASKRLEVHKTLAEYFKRKEGVASKDHSSRWRLELAHHERRAGMLPTAVVASRVRPLIKETLEDTQKAIDMLGNQTSIHVAQKLKRPTFQKLKQFTFDYSFNSSLNRGDPDFANQQVIWDELGRDVLDQFIDGFNVSVFAYGQTGSGKTHTMFGTESDPGLMRRVCKPLVNLLERKYQDRKSYTLSCSCFQIYKNKVQDLFDVVDGKPEEKHIVRGRKEQDGGQSNDDDYDEVEYEDLFGLNKKQFATLSDADSRPLTSSANDADEVRDVEDGGQTKGVTEDEMVYSVGKLKKIPVTDSSHIRKAIEEAANVRCTEPTTKNDTSSRSHCIFTIYLDRYDETVKINFVDLAGNEPGNSKDSKKERQIEASAINTSLYHLNRCICHLSKRKPQSVSVKPKDKKLAVLVSQTPLTKVLDDSLGGNTKLIMLATVSPCASDYTESLSTLTYAALCKDIKINVSAIHVSKKYDAFLSHNWGRDVMGRDNHQRVKVIKEGLEERGLNVWFDEDKMKGDPVASTFDGIDESTVVVVFVTRAYCEKIDSKNMTDNCMREFEWARKRKKPMIAVPMEQEMLYTDNWGMGVGFHLGRDPYRANFVADDEENLREQMDVLWGQICPPSVFISYCQRSKVKNGTGEWVNGLYAQKEIERRTGLKCWVDVEQLKVGGLEVVLREEMKKADCVVMLVESEFLKSEACQYEFRVCRDLGKPWRAVVLEKYDVMIKAVKVGPAQDMWKSLMGSWPTDMTDIKTAGDAERGWWDELVHSFVIPSSSRHATRT